MVVVGMVMVVVEGIGVSVSSSGTVIEVVSGRRLPAVTEPSTTGRVNRITWGVIEVMGDVTTGISVTGMRKVVSLCSSFEKNASF